MIECDNCDYPLSNRYATVFGDNNGTVHECLNCREESLLEESIEPVEEYFE